MTVMKPRKIQNEDLSAWIRPALGLLYRSLPFWIIYLIFEFAHTYLYIHGLVPFGINEILHYSLPLVGFGMIMVVDSEIKLNDLIPNIKAVLWNSKHELIVLLCLVGSLILLTGIKPIDLTFSFTGVEIFETIRLMSVDFVVSSIMFGTIFYYPLKMYTNGPALIIVRDARPPYSGAFAIILMTFTGIVWLGIFYIPVYSIIKPFVFCYFYVGFRDIYLGRKENSRIVEQQKQYSPSRFKHA